jgi:hypothetical protein
MAECCLRKLAEQTLDRLERLLADPALNDVGYALMDTLESSVAMNLDVRVTTAALSTLADEIEQAPDHDAIRAVASRILNGLCQPGVMQ